MVKFIAIGVWVLIVVFSTVMTGYMMRPQLETEVAAVHPEENTKLEPQSIDLVSVPVMVEGRVSGYVLVKPTYVLEGSADKSLVAAVAPFIIDEIYRQFFGAYSDTSQIERIKIDTVREQIIAATNERFGQQILKDIMIEQFNYITADQIRDIGRNSST